MIDQYRLNSDFRSKKNEFSLKVVDKIVIMEGGGINEPSILGKVLKFSTFVLPEEMGH